jgi:carboxylesterase
MRLKRALKWFWRRKLLVATAAASVLLGVGIAAYSWAASRSLACEIESTPRDPQTGIVLGAEAMSLGPPNAAAACLLLHGYVGARSDFADLGERISEEGFFVRMARLPGHGTTPVDFDKQTPESMLEGARAELEDLRSKFERVYLVGFSMGGAISTLLASEGGVDGLVLVAPYYKVTYSWTYVLPPETWNRLFSPILPYVIKADGFVKVNKRESLEHIYSYRTLSTQSLTTLVELGRLARQPEVLSRIDRPVLVLYSEGDEAASPQATKQVFEAIQSTDKTLRRIGERSNHILLWDYDAEDAKTAILDFLERVEDIKRTEAGHV